MGSRRTAPLILLVCLGAALVLARLWQIQVDEHAVWADEARKLVRTGEVLPYRRGAIRDGSGHALVRDQTVYRVELVYRDFRREHPLGQVAHARSAVLGRTVGLPETRMRLLPWASELVALSPGELHRYARGGGLRLGELYLPPTDDPWAARRPARASDLRYYVKGLLGLERDERRALVKLERDARTGRSYLEWLADRRGCSTSVQLAELEVAWLSSLEHLDSLAERLDWEDEPDDYALAPLDRLVHELEAWRTSVEDAAASRLFKEVTGFDAGRVESEQLLQSVDLGFVQAQFAWEPGRLVDWARQARYGWLRSWREGYALPRLLAELALQDETRYDADLALSFLAAVFAPAADLERALDGNPRPWRELSDLAVFEHLGALFATDAARTGEAWREPLEIMDDALRDAGEGRRASWRLLIELTDPARLAAVEETLRLQLGDAFDRRYDGLLEQVWERDGRSSLPLYRERVTALALALLDTWEHGVQARLVERFREARGGASERLAIAPDRLERLGERARHLLKDFGSRPVALHDDPSDDVVYLLTRWRDRYPGLVCERERERVDVVRPGRRAVLAKELLGAVSAIDADLAQRQRDQRAELLYLRRLVDRSPEQEVRLKSLMQELLLEGERRGVSGIEAYADRFLRGENGYRERLGLEDVYGKGARSIYLNEVADGEDLRLTLDPLLQAACSDTINRPVIPADDPDADRAWFEQPVGAIVLCTPDGRVLAAASAPDANQELGEEADGERGRVVDRTLRKPTFQPVGSVFKPFVAIHALDALATSGFDPSFSHVCEPPLDESWAEWGGVRCHSRWGHEELELHGALLVSCNAYFARVADELEPDDLVRVSEAFGFGQPTGVQSLEDASGWTEWADSVPSWDPVTRLDLQMRRAANGLQVLEGTPAQVARAMCGLATGELPELRLLDAVGGRALPVGEPVAVPYREGSLAFVREAMRGVCNDREGSAYSALSAALIGCELAAKTGSADLASRRGEGEDGRVRKHTWIAGWAPAHEPELVFCVFLHDTLATSGHSSVWVAKQLFEHPSVRAWLRAQGVDLRPVLATDPGGPR